MSSSVIASQTYTAISSTTNVLKGKGRLAGIFVSSASGGPTITGYDEAAGGTTTKIVDTFTPLAATWYPLPFAFGAGCNVGVGGAGFLSVAYSAVLVYVQLP